MHGVIACMHSNTVNMNAHGPHQCSALLLTTLTAVGDMAGVLQHVWGLKSVLASLACLLVWQEFRCTVCVD